MRASQETPAVSLDVLRAMGVALQPMAPRYAAAAALAKDELEALRAEVEVLRRERDQLAAALTDALPWIGVGEDSRGHWCPPEIQEAAREALAGVEKATPAPWTREMSMEHWGKVADAANRKHGGKQ